jgi:NodT family efflux transporter outer membrane factor (OMF) lipoprotein
LRSIRSWFKRKPLRGSSMTIAGFTRTRRAGCASLLAAALAGCTVGPNFERPAPWWSPTAWFGGRPKAALRSEPVAAPLDPNWWDLFRDRELTSLESRLAGSNLDVQVATVRIAESRAQLGIARADLFPRLNADGSYTRERISPVGAIAAINGANAGGSGFAGSAGSFGSAGAGFSGSSATLGAFPATAATGGRAIPPFDLWQYGFDSTWELDLWGSVRRGVESARATMQAAAENRRNTLVSAQAELARDYIQLRGVQRNIQIVRENLGTAQESLRLTQERAASGLTNELDVSNAQAQVNSVASQIPALQQQEGQAINALSLLLGEAPRALQAELGAPKPIPPVPPRVPVGLPSDLIRRRPDIRAAEAQLHAATADIGVAVAAFFPSVSLSGSFGFQALTLAKTFSWDSRQYGIGPTVSLPIFQGGRLRATLQLRKQTQKEAALTYQRTVLQALHDVDNALIAYTNEQRRRDQLQQDVNASRRALDLARQRYTQGVATFLDVLDAERTVLAAEQQLNDSTTTVSTNLVALYKALGGGWEMTYPVEPAGNNGVAGAGPDTSCNAAAEHDRRLVRLRGQPESLPKPAAASPAYRCG